ncbi:MFS transporter [Gammaproteobacteria bacterium]|nr:MFS transporter [Gammaproteobacteria bacterium]MDC0577005.1 MFS transporter [Gammaproteobacteria bacterium]
MELIKSRILSEGSIWHIGSLSAVYLSQGLSGGTLFALTTYLVSIGASVSDISLLLSITMIPWTLKVFMGPVIDSFTLNRFGRRRFWILISQVAMMLALVPFIFIEVKSVNFTLIALLTLHNSFVAISDISIDALAADSIREDQLANANGFMWGSKTLGRGSGMALSTYVFYSYGVNEAFFLLILIMSLIFLFPLFSKELPYKAGFQSVSYKNRLTLKELITGVSQSLFNMSALAAMTFMIFSNIGYGIFDVIYNEFYIEVLGWSGEDIGYLRPVGMWLGGLLGLSAGILTLYFGKRFLLLFFITCQAFIFLAVSTFTADTPDSLSTIAIVGVDAVDAGWSVLIFSILMALCTSNTSATNFGIFMGFGNISMLIGNNIAPLVLGSGDYGFAFIVAALSLIPCLLTGYYLTRS